jgi:hypothetical protein
MGRAPSRCWSLPSTRCLRREPGVAMALHAVPLGLRFTYVTPVLVTKLRMETPGQDPAPARDPGRPARRAGHGGGGQISLAHADLDGRLRDQAVLPGHPEQPRAVGPELGAAAVASFVAAVLFQRYLCGVCSCQEVLRRNGRGQAFAGACEELGSDCAVQEARHLGVAALRCLALGAPTEAAALCEAMLRLPLVQRSTSSRGRWCVHISECLLWVGDGPRLAVR